MKKFFAVLVVLAMVVISSMAFAADVTVGGSVQVRSREFNTMNFDKDAKVNQVDTQERIMLDVNAKAGDNVKGKISLWNDFDTWGRLEQVQGNNGFGNSTSNTGGHFGFREAWVNFNLPDIPVNVTAGHQLLQLGHGYFFRSMHFGSDAWVVANVTGANTVALVNVKASEGDSSRASDDIDAYVLLDVFKINDNNTVGIDITNVKVRPGVAAAVPLDGIADVRGTNLTNISVNYTGKLGPVNLKAQGDVQTGKVEGGATEPKFKGNQIVVKGNIPVDPVTINFLLARGSGSKAGDTDIKVYVPILDIDPHYTFLYEYKLATTNGAAHTGFMNTTAISAGVAFAATKSLNLGLDIYSLTATEKVTNTLGEESSEVGTEADVTVNWKLYDNLSWNWNLGYFKPGKALKTASGKTDAAMGAQGILSFTF